MIRIDSESSFRFPDEKKPRIIIGTEMAFQHVRWDKTELVTFLDIDKQLALPEFLAAEHVWHLIQEAVYLQNEASIFYIQTFNPRHLVLKSLVEPDRFYRTDLNLRRSLGYPPYQYLVRYFFGHPNQFVAKRQAEQLEWRLKEELTKAKKQIILSSHIEMHPRFYRKKFWYMLLAKLPTKDWEDNLSWLNQYIPGSWKIDPNPISILSP
jgi:primosomal protein N'